MLRGPLQFVWPIAHRVRTLRGHALPGFHDSELWPADAVALATTPVLDPTRPDLGLAPRWRSAPTPTTLGRIRRWCCTATARPPERMARTARRPERPERPERMAPGLTLQPMGCTSLRRAGFAGRRCRAAPRRRHRYHHRHRAPRHEPPTRHADESRRPWPPLGGSARLALRRPRCPPAVGRPEAPGIIPAEAHRLASRRRVVATGLDADKRCAVLLHARRADVRCHHHLEPAGSGRSTR